MAFSTTEITSNEIVSDNPIHQRLFFAYTEASKIVQGNLLEIGCGVGRGLSVLLDKCDHYSAIDKNEKLIQQLKTQYPQHYFECNNIPPFGKLADNTYDYLVSFQVIEHIQDDDFFVKEIHRVLKKGGKAIITTPNIKNSLTRNPWHTREYTAASLELLLSKYFSKIEKKGVTGNARVLGYFEENKKAVQKWKKWDILGLEKRLPRWALQIPYDFLNRLNRKKLVQQTNGVASEIDFTDYKLSNDPDTSLDLFFIIEK
jgi:2-polyprenyl-3-methyl-5-hydroxy-6-metoxy-1,4-benzoquinol methylase